MTAHTWWLLLILTVAIAALICLINSRLRVHPFVALILVSVGTGIAAGEPAAKLAGSIEEGAGGTLGDVGVTLALGAMLGRLLSDSGATDAIARALVARAEPRRLPWLVGAAAFVIGVPMFFEVGLIVLLPLIFSVARRMEEQGGAKGSPYVLLGVPAIASLSTLHGMLPPHPGPLTAMTGLHADLGLTLGVGIVCAVPTVILAGPVYARWIAPRLPDVAPDAELVAQFTGAERQPAGTGTSAPGARASAEVPRRTGVPTGLAVAAVLVPVVLMLLRTLAETALDESSGLGAALVFAGEPLVAMLAGFVFALGVTMVGSARSGSGRSGEETRASLTDSLKSIAAILLIIGGGGAFKQVLQDSGIGDAIASAAEGAHINVILLGWLIALLLSLTTGSATVGIVSATGIVAPLIGDGGGLEASLLVVAIGAGSLGLNYVNHAGFWLVKESFGMDLTQATKTQTAVQTLVSVLGLAMALLLSVFA
ncbi:gluconate transporter [Streptomyces sp. PRh5]|uniref:GntP family permease n=1 Tax=Streptomyces sp. PRh5 TaxID=1158056 RepID=UPI00044C5E11|nr:gluconate:H+ symporter [Streptomyces sp. PRh5]EXU66687.1 gluconate transporter [Streptomyces sp. PRh5]